MSEKADGLDALKREVFNAVEANPYIHGVDALAVADFVFDHLAQRELILQEGWVAVPRELSRNAAAEMEDVYGSDTNIAQWLEWWQEVYKDLLAAAPKMEGEE